MPPPPNTPVHVVLHGKFFSQGHECSYMELMGRGCRGCREIWGEGGGGAPPELVWRLPSTHQHSISMLQDILVVDDPVCVSLRATQSRRESSMVCTSWGSLGWGSDADKEKAGHGRAEGLIDTPDATQKPEPGRALVAWAVRGPRTTADALASLSISRTTWFTRDEANRLPAALMARRRLVGRAKGGWGREGVKVRRFQRKRKRTPQVLLALAPLSYGPQWLLAVAKPVQAKAHSTHHEHHKQAHGEGILWAVPVRRVSSPSPGHYTGQ
jgi:hypothetical protein